MGGAHVVGRLTQPYHCKLAKCKDPSQASLWPFVIYFAVLPPSLNLWKWKDRKNWV